MKAVSTHSSQVVEGEEEAGGVLVVFSAEGEEEAVGVLVVFSAPRTYISSPSQSSRQLATSPTWSSIPAAASFLSPRSKRGEGLRSGVVLSAEDIYFVPESEP
ncbi:hypothetical protein E2562_014701 [Oryza meyeriana var. granulata]|uniref:Uncharacterized protein n=1 Tax=Oryza meyeriana var. granulata TaxID=110450 RepID=A0A6G1D3V8_9ORYZ|nr:hypothetical protein E2562_014701 [Oryza meyeriana var. granulata]